MTTHVQQTLLFLWICAPTTHYGLVDQGSVEYKVCRTLLHMTSTGNRTPDLLLLSLTLYPLGNMLPTIPPVIPEQSLIIMSPLAFLWHTLSRAVPKQPAIFTVCPPGYIALLVVSLDCLD